MRCHAKLSTVAIASGSLCRPSNSRSCAHTEAWKTHPTASRRGSPARRPSGQQRAHRRKKAPSAGSLNNSKALFVISLQAPAPTASKPPKWTAEDDAALEDAFQLAEARHAACNSAAQLLDQCGCRRKGQHPMQTLQWALLLLQGIAVLHHDGAVPIRSPRNKAGPASRQARLRLVRKIGSNPSSSQKHYTITCGRIPQSHALDRRTSVEG